MHRPAYVAKAIRKENPSEHNYNYGPVR